ncbi:MAG TPA: alpha/beta hydrolase [Trichocoleus sp.]|jgi:pimeloyl-ACP methyl ester carboxylesterase
MINAKRIDAKRLLAQATQVIRDRTAIELIQQIQHYTLSVSLQHQTISVSTAYVHRACPTTNTAPILLLPGFDSSLLEFRHLLPLLSTQQSVWAVDRFGSGFTEFVPGIAVDPGSIRQHLYAVWQAFIQRPVILVGASLGGATAIDFTLHYPELVRSLVLIDSVGFSGGFPIGQFLPDFVCDWGADWLFVRKWAAIGAASVFPDPALTDAIRCAQLHQAMPGWKQAIVSWTQSGGYDDLHSKIQAIKHPTLILWGEKDDVLGIADAHQFEQAIEQSKLQWIKHCGHTPHLEQPQQVASAIQTYNH